MVVSSRTSTSGKSFFGGREMTSVLSGSVSWTWIWPGGGRGISLTKFAMKRSIGMGEFESVAR